MGKTKNGNSKKSNRNKRRKKTWLDEEKDSAKTEVDRLAQRFNIKKKKKTLEEELAEYEASCSSAQNGSSHEKLNKPYLIKFQSDIIPMIWACSLCGKGYAHDSLGDLFGPYYIASPRKNPEYLCTKESKKKSREPNCELWFHGDCLLWAPGIILEKTRLVNLEESMYKFWDQKCEACHKPGAAIPIDNNFIHFPCAKSNSTYYKLNDADFTCERLVSNDPGSPQL